MHRQNVANKKNLFISIISFCLSVAKLQKKLDISHINADISKRVVSVSNTTLMANPKVLFTINALVDYNKEVVCAL
jgi:hypothetical protein